MTLSTIPCRPAFIWWPSTARAAGWLFLFEFMHLRNCPRCLNTAVIEDGYCGTCRECTLSPLALPHGGPTAPPDPVGLIASLQKQVEQLREALREIAKGEGQFSLDPLTHAGNTIDAMKQLATEALEQTKP